MPLKVMNILMATPIGTMDITARREHVTVYFELDMKFQYQSLSINTLNVIVNNWTSVVRSGELTDWGVTVTDPKCGSQSLNILQ